MHKYLLTLAFLAASQPAFAAEQHLLKRAAEVVRMCQTAMPAIDVEAMMATLMEAGFSAEGGSPAFRTYSLDGRRILIGLMVDGPTYKGCVVGVSQMNPSEGLALATPWLEATTAQPALEKTNKTPGDQWIGTLGGSKVRIEVINEINFGHMRGAAISISSE